MPHEFDPGRPIYTQLCELMTQAIVSGEYEPGQKLPGVRELALQYGVNPNTAQRTMAELERQELVYSERTSGRFVTKDGNRIAAVRREAALREAEAFMKRMINLGLTQDETRALLAQAADAVKGEQNG